MSRIVRPSLLGLLLSAALGNLAPAAQPATAATSKAVAPTPAAVGEPSRRLVYKTVGDRKLELHVFDPAGFRLTDRRTCFVVIHGGGWGGGTVESFYDFAAQFAQRGCVAMSVDYRLLGKPSGVTVFDCVRDGRSVVRYLRQHAAEIGIDPQKIIVSGGSAGAHVAAGTALFDGIDDPGDDPAVSCVPNALVLYYPVIDTSPEGYGNAKCGERWREISPLHRVKPGLPPTILFHGTADVTTPYAGAKAFTAAMLQAGNRCELVTQEGGIHGYLVPTRSQESFVAAMARTEEFLLSLRLLGPGPGPR